MSIEARARRLLSGLEDLPDWAYMKAIELSRAMDEGDLDGETLAVNMILLTTALDRRIKMLEGENYLQQYWNDWFEANIDYFGEVLPVDPDVWSTGEEDDDDEEDETE